MKLLLDGKESIADGVVLLTLRHPGGHQLPSWTPGAHVDLVLGDGLVRQYSLCGDPDDTSVLRVAVLREDTGRGGSRYVHDVLAIGHTVEIRGPRNHFPLVDAARYLFIAGGIGITPILPMLAEVAARDWRLVYGGRTRSSMAFREELQHRGNVLIQPQDEHGLLDLPALLADVDDDTAVYCCGPEPLLAAVEKHHTRGKLHVERFTPKAGAADGPRQEFEVELARTGGVLRVPADRSILDVVERSGVPVLSSCQEGTCGTCETPVLSGTPDHRDSLLTDEERAAGDVMMICVSRARSDRLVLDL
ncbi:ferredoxin [Lentzea aerocolonigenes]|uniref:Ferredoxin n=1 Tax=Lentzea aerocolonigenes TaxID=68170 RepID=A0A0F0GYC1_LENAE|nr:PDR/VanB family oxidoreductase [Lentzea aerocolonigenes]KJK48305.1 ferredoxin [Lentzea aerocolonigenes]